MWEVQHRYYSFREVGQSCQLWCGHLPIEMLQRCVILSISQVATRLRSIQLSRWLLGSSQFISSEDWVQNLEPIVDWTGDSERRLAFESPLQLTASYCAASCSKVIQCICNTPYIPVLRGCFKRATSNLKRPLNPPTSENFEPKTGSDSPSELGVNAATLLRFNHSLSFR